MAAQRQQRNSVQLYHVLDPPTGHRAARCVFVVINSSVSPPSYCLVAFRLVFLWRPCVGPSAGHIIRLIVPADSYFVVGTRPAPWAHVLLRIFFFKCCPFMLFPSFLRASLSSCLSFFLCVCVFVFFFLDARMMPWIVVLVLFGLQVMWDDRWHRSPCWYMVRPCALFRTCMFSPIEMHFFRACFCEHRQDFREAS